MCRLLLVQSEIPFSIADYLRPFAHIAQHSKEYQGHGWGCAYLADQYWVRYRNLTPIWEDNLDQFGTTRLLLAHARSAFRDEGIVVENNMPFWDNTYMFIFNGELRGVRIREEGRTGAEKIFRVIRRFERGDLKAGVHKAVTVIEKRTRYVRAMNFMIASRKRVVVNSYFNEDPAYFTLHRKPIPGGMIIASEPFAGETDWEAIPNRTIEEYTWSF